MGGHNTHGYAVVSAGGRTGGFLTVHTAWYQRLVGEVPPGLVLDHLCRNRWCVNPAHLEPVTSAENARRGARTKLTADQVESIRRRVGDGESQGAVARSIGISAPHISRIVSGHRWSPVPRAIERRHARLMPLVSSGQGGSESLASNGSRPSLALGKV
ncbi:HNH endonuclease [Luteitalea sp.]